MCVGQISAKFGEVVTSLPLSPPLPASIRAAWALQLGAVLELTKPKLACASLLTTLVAYGTARPVAGPIWPVLLGTSLSAAGALSLNQWWERHPDSLMQRTRNRPLPQARLAPATALGWSLGLGFAGIGVLAAAVNLTAASLAASTILLYGLVYTPLKKHTRWATELGAVSGALPPLIGNAAAGDMWSAPGTALAAVLLLWQMPHFFAIGWRHRADYRAAGFRLLPVIDVTGHRTAGWSLFYSTLLLPVSLAPCVTGSLGLVYGVPVAATGLFFWGRAWRFLTDTVERDGAARRLFFASILYLPIVLGALALDRLVLGQ